MRRKIAEFATGVAAAVVAFAAVPAVLVVLVGLPLPRHWARVDVLSWRGLFDLLAVMAWVAWVACCWPLLRSVVSRVRRRDVTAAAGARLPEWLAARIAAAVLAVAPVGLALGAVASASEHRSPPAAHAAPAPSTGAVARGDPAPTPPAALAAANGATDGVTTALGETPADTGSADTGPVPAQYTVVAGDSLWSIAERLYGDGGEWSAIAQANLGRLMSGGTRFVDPSLIRPGWVLSIPQPGAGVTGEVADGTPADPGSTTTPVAAQPAGSHPSVSDAAATSGKPGVARGSGATGRSGVTRGSGANGRSDARARTGGRTPSKPPTPAPLPELAALGVGVLVAAALARRARKARHVASLARREGQPLAVASELAADTAALLVPFDDMPVLDWVEVANRHLTGALAEAGRTIDAPAAQLVRAGPDGVEVRLREPVGWAPGRWVLRDGQVWHLSSALDPEVVAGEARGHEPWLPALVPVGENDDGTWLIPVEPGSCLPVIGAQAHPLVSAMRAVVESWAWSEQVVVTDDPAIADHESALVDQSTRSLHRPRVVFVGDPGLLPTGTRARCGVVTTLPVEATDLTVVVDARAASLHPLGVTVRPHLLDHARDLAVADLVRTPEPEVDAGSTPYLPARPHAPSTPRTPHRPHEPLAPGPVEIRMLTAVPRIDGLSAELPPKLARRATELAAYLALHYPDPVTSDRLRTRVLGSADADAAAKTLFNIVGAGRRAMGRDASGELFLPPATKSGHYRMSPLVTVDAARVAALVAAADAALDPRESMALLRAAVGLVESEPLAGALTGYGWWCAEGHERRIAATLVDGACRLARLAARSGHLDLARWGLEQARLVEPYSEALSRVAMQVAAEAGDPDRLRREWAECQGRVDELDPGSLPSEATERLYVELRRRVDAHAVSDTDR